MGGTGGIGGMGGMGGMGGSGGGPISCIMNETCDDQNPCTTESCEQGFCQFVVLDGVPTPDVLDVAGDCKKAMCTQGIDTLSPDDLDVPNDGFECTTEACMNGAPIVANLDAGSPCGANMNLVCNGQGVCVGCNAPADCQGIDTVCQTRTCVAGTCGVQNAPSGTFVDGAGSGDCRQTECNGAGSITTGPDNNDLPADDGLQCTDEVCVNGMPYHPFSSAGSACNENGGKLCNGGGACVECLAATDCPGMDTECKARTCSLGQCGVNYEPVNTIVSGQTPGDCKTNICDGMGAIVAINENTDIPASDGNGCTDEICANGIPVHFNVPNMTPCTDNNGTLCAFGTCVQCISAADCPGTDTECSTRTCNAGLCGHDFANAGTVLQNQTSGDCQTASCDGLGNVISSANNSDPPVDGLECTTDVCTNGVPTNPPLPVRTACSQNGGVVCNSIGQCVPDPSIVSITPADNQSNVSTASPIRITFNTAMNPATLTGQTTNGSCTGSIQLSHDNFTSCWGFAASTPTMSGGDTIATLTPAPQLSYSTNYQVRVTTAAQSAGGISLDTQFTQSPGFVTKAPIAPCGGSVVISQVYGSGGDLGSTLINDYVELHNRGNTPVDVTNWSIQYASAIGSFGMFPDQTTTLTGIIPPGGFYLIQLAPGSNGTVSLPTPDAVGNTNFDSTSGKVALVNNSTPLSGTCPSDSSIVDFVGYGVFSNCFEGTAAAPTPSAVTIANTRVDNGCADTNDNNADFSSNTANPRNTSSPTNICACGANVTANETGRPDELDYCNVQFPLSLSVPTGQTTPLIFGRVYEAGVTNPGGADPAIVAEMGYGPANVNPSTQSGFVYVPAVFNTQYGNDDEYKASFTVLAAPGSYRYVVRFSLNGVSWTYCDVNGAGSDPTLTFDVADLPVLTVTP